MIEFNATFLVSMMSFILFIMIMNAIFYNPILNIIKKREEYITSNYNHSENNTESVNKLEQAYRSEYEQAKTESRKTLNEEIEKAQNSADKYILDEKQKNKNVLLQKKEALFNDAKTLENQLETIAKEDIASMITSKILEEN